MASPVNNLIELRRAHGKPSGSHMDDLVACQKAVTLCQLCSHKFGDPRKKGYYKDRRFNYAIATCDDCREHGMMQLFIPERFMAGPGNKSRSGHSWLHS